ncbi:MAG: ATP-binding protein [Acidobacteriia bacterium]|nr:ATP-binding protein [Terriglobia bacterium]
MTEHSHRIVSADLGIPLHPIYLSLGPGNAHEDAVRLGQLRARKKGDLLTKALQVVEPSLESVEDISATGTPMIWGDIGLPELTPLSAMGEGVARIARIVLATSSVPGGVVLVDEIENGFHHSVMKKVWSVVEEAAQLFDAQVIATTHSYECLMAAHEALRDEWRFHRLDRTKEGSSQCVTFDTERVEAAIRHWLEVR